MFTVNDDLSIYATRGDTVFFTVMAEDEMGATYFFEAGDVLRIKVFQKKNANKVVLEKCFPITAKTDRYTLLLTEEDTKFGDVISKPVDYWYEVELNPFTNPQTIIGYDEDGAKIFKLFPEGKDSEVVDPDPEDIPVVDDVLDMTSNRPVQNQAISRAIVNLEAAYNVTKNEVAEAAEETANSIKNMQGEIDTEKANLRGELATERARIDKLVNGETANDAEVVDVRIGADGDDFGSAGTAVRSQILSVRESISSIFKKNSANLFEPLSCVMDSGISGTTGNFVETLTHWRTKKLSTNGAASIVCNYAVYKWAFYDANGGFISTVTQTNSHIKPCAVPENAAFFAVQFQDHAIAFSDRFTVCVLADAAIPGYMGEKYRLPATMLDGEIPFLYGSIVEDENNLFDPMRCSEHKAMTDSGEYFNSAGFWVSDCIPVHGYQYVTVNEPYYKAVFYDSENATVDFLQAVMYSGIAVPDGAYYVRFQFDEATIPFNKRFSIVVCGDRNSTDAQPKYMLNKQCVEGLDVLSGLVKTDENNLLDPVKCMAGKAFASTTGIITGNAKFWTTDFIPANGLTDIVANVPVYKYAWLDADKNILTVTAPAPEGTAFLLVQFDEEVVPFASRFDVVLCDSTNEISLVNPRYFIDAGGANDKVDKLGQFKFSIPLVGTTYMSDHTFINGQLYAINASSDDHSEYAGVTVYDVDFETGTSQYVRKFQHNLGHANSIDYCPGNGCLILGDGSNNSTLPGYIFVLPDAANKTTWEYNDCIVIDLSAENWDVSIP